MTGIANCSEVKVEVPKGAMQKEIKAKNTKLKGTSRTKLTEKKITRTLTFLELKLITVCTNDARLETSRSTLQQHSKGNQQ